MIEINLLPPEMRKIDRTSLKRLASMVTAVILLSASVIGVTVFLRNYYAAQAEKQRLTTDVNRLEPLAKEYDVLSAELKGIETRLATIDEIRATRVRWGKKLDQLYAILPDYVWLDKIELKTARGATPNAGPTAKLTLDCFLAGADEKRYAEFRRVLTGELVSTGPYNGVQFFEDFAKLGYSGWSREDFPSTEEGVALKFNLELDLKTMAAAAQPQTARVAAAPAAAK
jgi:Tfp pilus assembly protein PilN